jgi:hypothetical protein
LVFLLIRTKLLQLCHHGCISLGDEGEHIYINEGYFFEIGVFDVDPADDLFILTDLAIDAYFFLRYKSLREHHTGIA